MPKKPTYEKLEQRVKELEKESHDSKRLDEQRRFLLLAIERSSEGMAMADMSGNLEYLNDAFANMHGYSPDELVGKNLSIFHSPEQLPVVEAANQQIQETGSFKGELWHVRRDGTVFPTLMHNSLLRDEAGNTIGMIGTLRDISDLKAKEEETKASEAKFRELFNNMSSGVAIYEAKDNGNDFIFKDFNEAAERIDNIKKEDIIGKSVLEVFPGVKEFGLFDVFKRVWETGKPEDHPISLYKDQRISGWRENYVYKLPSGEIVAVYEDITDRKQIEEKLRKEDALKSSILDAIPHAVIGVRERRITFANDGVEPVFGWKPEELIGKNTRIFYRTDEEYEEIGNRIYPVLEKKRTHTVAEDIYMRRKDGRDIICRATSARIGETLKENEIIATFEDVTDRRHAEEALRESEEKYRGLINGMSDTVWVIDFDANFIDVNDASVEVLGYSREELLSMGPQDIDTSVGVEEIKGLIEQMPTDEIQLFETTHITKDGKTIPVEVKSSLVTYKGKQVILSIARDITERKRAEAEIKSHQEHIALINQILRHDLTNDLVVIQSAINFYNESPEEGLLKEISSRTEKSLELIKNMRELEFFVSRHRKLKVCDMRDVIETVVENYPSVAFKIKGKARVMADDALSSVIDNIIGNAVIHGKADRITITTGKEGDMCAVRIADNGAGIPDDIKEKIFEEGFIYGDTGHTGIGLHIVEKAMESYGGYAYVEDNETKGTVIALRFRMVK